MILNMVGGGGGGDLNFSVVGGTSAPSNPKENTIWVNTDTEITGWHFCTDEPDVYDLLTRTDSDAHTIMAPHQVSAGDVLNFEIPATAHVTREALRILDPVTGKSYYIRDGNGTAAGSWSKGTMVGVLLSGQSMPIGSHGSGSGTALIRAWGKYYHKEGEVWVTVGSESPVSFNAVKKNSVQVYPISAKQYVGGAWTDVTAKSYQGGKWVEWFTYLLQSGAFEIAAAEYLHNTSTQSETQGDGYIEFSSTSSSGTDKTIVRGRMTEAAVDLTGIDTIYAKVNVTSAVNETNTAGSTLAILTGTTQSTKVAATESREIGEGLMALDVSQYSGSYYIMFGAFAYRANSGSPTGTVRFYDVYW